MNFEKWQNVSKVLGNVMENITEGFWNTYIWWWESSSKETVEFEGWTFIDQKEMRCHVILSNLSAMLNLVEPKSCSQICHLPLFLHLEGKTWLSL